MNRSSGKVSGLLSPIFHFILFGNVAIALIAVLLCRYTEMQLHLTKNYRLQLFVFFATLASYNLHAYFNPHRSVKSLRLNWIQQNRKILLASFFISIIGIIITFSLISDYFLWILPLVALSVLYTMPRVLRTLNSFWRKVIYIKTIYLAFTWTIVTVALPALLNDYPPDKQLTLFFLNRFSIIMQVSLLFEFKDKKYGLNNLPGNLVTGMSVRNFNLLFYSLSLLFFLTAVLLYMQNPENSLFFSALLGELAFISIYKKCKSTNSDYWYYLVVDGIMVIPVLILLIYRTVS